MRFGSTGHEKVEAFVDAETSRAFLWQWENHTQKCLLSDKSWANESEHLNFEILDSI